MPIPELTRVEPWAAHPAAAPRCTRLDTGVFRAEANGTRTCSGGWQFVLKGLEPGRSVSIRIKAEIADLEQPRDNLFCTAIWGNAPADGTRIQATVLRDALLPRETGPGQFTFSRTLEAPAEFDCLTVRCTLRWTATGRVDLTMPEIKGAAAATKPLPATVRVAVVTGAYGGRPPIKTVQDNVRFYADLCEKACRETHADLVALPEVALTWGVGNALDVALPAPGPETDVFADIAHRYNARIAVGMHERDGDACHNSIVLVGPDGSIEARYRKVHFAWGEENESGLLPGDGFPVADTPIGRIGFNICMDSSAAESVRMVGLNGADFLVLAIMGDHRASRWNPGAPLFNPDRWLAIQRTRAMDTQLCMVIARNNVIGSCIIDRKGDVLAWNEGDREWIAATVNLQDGYRSWNGWCFRDINWGQRRPHVYTPYTDSENFGSLRQSTPGQG